MERSTQRKTTVTEANSRPGLQGPYFDLGTGKQPEEMEANGAEFNKNPTVINHEIYTTCLQAC